MKFRALAIDLDGTLLVGEEVPEENRRAVQAARDAGLQIIVATARWHQMAARVASHLGISGPIIACSGAQVYLPAEDRDIFDERLPAAFVAELYECCDAHRCVATVTVTDEVLLKLDGEPDASAMSPEMRWVKKLTGAADSLPRVAAIQGSAINAQLKSEFKPRFGETVHFFDSIGPSGKVILTLTGRRASKGVALREACAHLGLVPADVVAFGDAENDLEMFAVAGAAVAMGQASDAVKAAATYVTERNDQAGVAKAIDRLLFAGRL